MLTALQNRVGEVGGREAQVMRELRVVPIGGPSQAQPEYRLLEGDTLAGVRVTEVSDAGSVPELLVENTLRTRVFLMDGQELVGAKQNRILNTDVLVPAETALKIPVSCVEAGRWDYRSAAFSPGRTASHRIRQAKVRRVHASLAATGRHDADQVEVWNEVAADLERAACASPTRALSDAYAARQQDLEAQRRHLHMPDDAVGLAVFREGAFLGLDLFDRHATLQYFWQSLLDSYALSLPGEDPQPRGRRSRKRTAASSEPGQVDQLLKEAVQGVWQPFRSPGEGQDYRMDGRGMSGAALVWADRSVLHLQLFAAPAPEREETGQVATRRPSLRRRYLPRM